MSEISRRNFLIGTAAVAVTAAAPVSLPESSPVIMALDHATPCAEETVMFIRWGRRWGKSTLERALWEYRVEHGEFPEWLKVTT